MLIRATIDGPLFYEFIFNLSFDPRLVCPSGFMLSPLGSEVMVSCHVAFFCVICYNLVLHIKMTTTAPPGHVHEDLSTFIDEVKPALVDKRKLVLHYLVLLSLHCLVFSRSKHNSSGHTLSLSLLTAGHRSSRILSAGKVRWCNVHAVVLGDGSYPLSVRADQRALPFSPMQRWLGRASNPFFIAAVVWADTASLRPPSDIPADLRYNFLRNRPCSTSRAPHVATFVSLTISQPPS